MTKVAKAILSTPSAAPNRQSANVHSGDGSERRADFRKELKMNEAFFTPPAIAETIGNPPHETVHDLAISADPLKAALEQMEKGGAE
jgi:hypothetical protein